MSCEINPLIEWSIGQTGPDQWIIGSKMVCERVQDQESKPVDALVSWEHESQTFYLRKRTPQDPTRKGNTETDKAPGSGGSAAVWCIGDRHFKAYAWHGGMELESTNIRFVKDKVPSVPVPDVIYEWTDPDFNRSFLVTKKIRGRTLEEAWLHLGPRRRELLAEEVACHISQLAKHTSSSFKTVCGRGVFEPRLLEKPREERPCWLPRLLGPFKEEDDMRNYMLSISNEVPPEIDQEFHFYHAELGPKNIILRENGAVAGIINWESAGYYPSFWVATKPLLDTFDLECDREEPKSWAHLLRRKLEVHLFTEQDRKYERWVKGML
ncbi:unnamed protein product [Clonostachys rosea f. rosea IK726]|uniref:Aminoglycoside phosphotransferase domain-containing protein n=2 Tax=Bionectria ochroleuca TaxID=29856 RepID=A0A0B7JWR3_BIOOC|nr:unnamed protein product [Clonostachys rosea f. rosea IK726]